MMLLNTSLLRERFAIHSTKTTEQPIVAVGNRILLPLFSEDKSIQERFVVRAQSMHIALRLAALITSEFYRRGPLLNRTVPVKWSILWDEVTADYERLWNPNLWGCVYHNGKPLFRHGDYHPFLDVIEQCDIKNRVEYDRAIFIAEDAFKQAGKSVRIEHDVNIGVIIGAMEKSIRCGLILRAPSHTSTFNFTINEKPNDGIRLAPEHGLDIAACFLEGIQLAFATGIDESKQKAAHAAPIIPTQSTYNRIGRLNHIIQTFEKDYIIRYRPERPDFKDIIKQARKSRKDTV